MPARKLEMKLIKETLKIVKEFEDEKLGDTQKITDRLDADFYFVIQQYVEKENTVLGNQIKKCPCKIKNNYLSIPWETFQPLKGRGGDCTLRGEKAQNRKNRSTAGRKVCPWVRLQSDMEYRTLK